MTRVNGIVCRHVSFWLLWWLGLAWLGSPPMRRAHSDSTVPLSEGNAPAAHRACSRSCASRAAPAARTASADPAFAASSAPIAAPVLRDETRSQIQTQTPMQIRKRKKRAFCAIYI